MGLIKWYKRDPNAALTGMMGLTLEERGAYNTVLDLIYTRDGNLPDDERFIAGWLSVDVRVWRRIKQRLIELEKLYVRDGVLRNSRADEEVLEALSRVGSATEAGRQSGVTRRRKSEVESSEINDLFGAPVEENGELTTTTPTTTATVISFPNGKDSSVDPPLTVEEIVEGWNDLADGVGLAKVIKLTPQRRKAALARLKEYPDVASWQAAFRHIRNTPFLRGETTDWRANFDFLVQASSFTKLVEGVYGKKQA